MKNIHILFLSLLLLASKIVSAQTETVKTIYVSKDFTIKTIPANADIFGINSNGGEQKLGTGAADLHADKNESYIIEVRKDGYQTVRKVYVRDKGGIDEDNVELENRVDKINASPSDAKIFANNVNKGSSPQEILIPKGQSVTVDVKYPGFVTQTKVYYNKPGEESPESSHLFKMEDRLISIRTVPIDASIVIDGKKMAEGNFDAVIKKDNCINVSVERLGYAPVAATYCNKGNEAEPPMTDELILKDRIAQINVQPENAKIFIDDKQMGKGTYTCKIPYGKCVDVFIESPGYAPREMTLCNMADKNPPESSYPVKLDVDEAYTESTEESSDKANKNFSIVVNANTTPTDAWKKVTSIVQSYFEEIEITDATSSYLKTNWVPRDFNITKGDRIDYTTPPSRVRTRVIITSGGSNPLAYNVKIQCEISKIICYKRNARLPSVSEDDCYETFPRLIRKYNDLIGELQRRLQ
jgi:hypothetical protein